MKYFLTKICACSLLTACCCFTSCMTVVKELPAEKTTNIEKDASYELAEKVLVCVLQNEPSSFLKLIAPELRKQFDQKDFEKSLNTIYTTIGEPESYQFLTKLDMAPLTPYIWKIRCKHIDESSEEVSYKEVLFRVIVGQTSDGPIVMAYNFI